MDIQTVEKITKPIENEVFNINDDIKFGYIKAGSFLSCDTNYRFGFMSKIKTEHGKEIFSRHFLDINEEDVEDFEKEVLRLQCFVKAFVANEADQTKKSTK